MKNKTIYVEPNPDFWRGEWDNEPVFKQFTSCGFDCYIIRSELGHLCGYVDIGVENQHITVDDFVDVHGGITFNGLFDPVYKCDYGLSLTHESWLIGFDCYHAQDQTLHRMAIKHNDAEYRNIEYVTSQIQQITGFMRFAANKSHVELEIYKKIIQCQLNGEPPVDIAFTVDTTCALYRFDDACYTVIYQSNDKSGYPLSLEQYTGCTNDRQRKLEFDSMSSRVDNQLSMWCINSHKPWILPVEHTGVYSGKKQLWFKTPHTKFLVGSTAFQTQAAAQTVCYGLAHRAIQWAGFHKKGGRFELVEQCRLMLKK